MTTDTTKRHPPGTRPVRTAPGFFALFARAYAGLEEVVARRAEEGQRDEAAARAGAAGRVRDAFGGDAAVAPAATLVLGSEIGGRMPAESGVPSEGGARRPRAALTDVERALEAPEGPVGWAPGGAPQGGPA